VVEVDSTFYGPPPRERFVSWRERTPDGFLFTLKMPGEVTHEVSLRDPRLALRFCEDARGLEEKLGPILIQLPPSHGPAMFEVTAAFLRVLPTDLRFAIEFRDRAWLGPETRDMLADVGVALALSVGPWMDEEAARAAVRESVVRASPMIYLRWLGAPARGRSPEEIAAGRTDEIRAWGELIRTMETGEVFAFFNNDYQGHSPASARRLQECIGQEPVAPAELSPQQDLFRD
jgi:uncharacterized protein YecE (DUF72 family)